MSINWCDLRRVLNYNPTTGFFTWIEPTSNRIRVGDIAGSVNKDGYVRISVFGEKVMAHRLAVFYMTGRWPDRFVDHENMVTGDNRYSNLRQATRSQNQQNRVGAQSNSGSGLLGAHWHKGTGKWRGRITSNGEEKHLGLFDTPMEAHMAYVEAKRAEHPFGTL